MDKELNRRKLTCVQCGWTCVWEKNMKDHLWAWDHAGYQIKK
jgi:hypothetical protein